MSELMEYLIQQNKFPSWWIEAIILEYLNCRRFAVGDDLCTIDYNLINEKDIIEALNNYKVCITSSPVVHNVRKEILPTKIVSLMIGKSEAISEEPDDIIPNGRISNYNFQLFDSSSDPKIGFGSHFQVRDEGDMYQWKFASFQNVEGRTYGKWVSSEIDLEPLDQVHDKIIYLKSNIKKPGETGHKKSKKEVKDFYTWLDKIRKPILSELWGIHKKNQKKKGLRNKLTKTLPPMLSHFEKFTVKEGDIFTKFFAEAVFFRSCLIHAEEARKLAEINNHNEFISNLDNIYLERSISVIMAAACLESFINNIGFKDLPQIWNDSEKLSFVSKWRIYLTFKGHGDIFDTGKEPYQTLSQIYNIRNYLMHYKSSYTKVKVKDKGKTTETDLQHRLNEVLINKLVTQVKNAIKELCSSCNIEEPFWLN